MKKVLIAQAALTIDAPLEKAWNALVGPAAIKVDMFGVVVITDWRGECKETPCEDEGDLLQRAVGNWKTMLKGVRKYVDTPVAPSLSHGGTR